MAKYSAVLEDSNYNKVDEYQFSQEFDNWNPYSIVKGHLCEVFWSGDLKCTFEECNDGLGLVYQNQKTGDIYIARLFRDGRPFRDSVAKKKWEEERARKLDRVTVFGCGRPQSFCTGEEAGSWLARMITNNCGPNHRNLAARVIAE